MSAKETILDLGAEGGGIEIFGRRVEGKGGWLFWRETSEMAYDDDLPASSSSTENAPVADFSTLLNSYWTRLYPLTIHPEFVDRVGHLYYRALYEELRKNPDMERDNHEQARWEKFLGGEASTRPAPALEGDLLDEKPSLLHRLAVEPQASVLIFVGAGMSAESGVPTYRGAGGIWEQYDYRTYACQEAFDTDPERVLDFHDLRRTTVAACQPHAGHAYLRRLQDTYGPERVKVVTANIDGLLQRAGIEVLSELHGSLWRQRCPVHGILKDATPGPYVHRHCPRAGCGQWLRPDITWFGDQVNPTVFDDARCLAVESDMFIAIGTSGAVWPASSIAKTAHEHGAEMIEVNPEENQASELFSTTVRLPASQLEEALG